MHALRSFAKPESAVDNNAYTFTSTYAGGSGSGLLNLYTMHPTASSVPGRNLDFHMTQCRSFAMTDDIETFRKGTTALRNAREWALEQRTQIILAANHKIAETVEVEPQEAAASQSTSATDHDSDTSFDELSSAATIFTSFSSNTSRGRRRARDNSTKQFHKTTAFKEEAASISARVNSAEDTAEISSAST